MWTPLPSTGTGTAKKPSGRPHIDHFNFIISLLLFLSYFFCYTQFFGKQIEDITCPRVDMNFIFKWSTRYLTSERSSEIPNQLAFKGAIYYVTITTVISSRVKITCYLHVWRYEVFTGKLTWYYTGVYIINIFIIPLLRHFTIFGQENAQNMRR